MNIAKAMLEIGSLEADKRNSHDNYDYISSDKILQQVGETLGQLGVIVIPGANSVNIQQYTYGGDKSMFSAIVNMTMTVIDGNNTYTVEWVGCGVDYRVPDKAVYKAITSGHKYFLTKMLMIGIGNEDSEHDTPEAPVKKQSLVKEAQDLGGVSVYTAVVQAGLAENEHSAKNALAKCRTGYNTSEKAIAWMRVYRGYRDQDMDSQSAADKANEELK